MFLTLIVAFKFNKNLKENSKIYYGCAYVIAVADIVYRVFLVGKFSLPHVVLYIEKPMVMGAMAGAMFVVVMYAGALPNGKWYTQKLMSVRAELSILASIFFLPHTIPNCLIFVKNIPKMDLSSFSAKIYVLISISAIVALVVIIPLWITSYKSIRKKMKAKRWKSLQRWAYLVYFLIYAHISILFLAMGRKQYEKFMIYTAVFAMYTYLRLKKYLDNKKKIRGIKEGD